MTLLDIEGLEGRHGLLRAFQDVTLGLAAGEKIALVGANGAGKTTLLRTLAGVHPAARGRIRLEGVDITQWPGHRRVAQGLALVPEGRRLFAAMTVEENLRIAQSAERGGAWQFDSVLEALPQLKPKLQALAGTLSGGQQQAVAIGRALMTNPRVLLLDEVSLGLSPVAVQGVYDSLARLFDSGTAIVLVEQDLERAVAIADRVVCMREGRIVAIGRAGEMSREEVLGHYFGQAQGAPIHG